MVDYKIEKEIKRIINTHGWYVAMFEATEYLPSFAYTIGLWENYNHPELIIFGLSTDNLHVILNNGGEMVKAGYRIQKNEVSNDFFGNSKAFIVEVDQENINDYFGYGIGHIKNPFPVYQIIWTDRNGYYPWEIDFEVEFSFKQPLLDRNSTFKFREEKNLGVVTTIQFLEDNKPITFVEHDENGDWIFLTNDHFYSSDARLISLEDMVRFDQTLNQVFNLDYGGYATRDSIGALWERAIKELT